MQCDFKRFLIICILCFTGLHAQQVHRYLPDAFSEAITSPQPSTKVSTINLTGNLQELVVAVGFPVVSSTYPVLTNNSTNPLLGINRAGTLLSSYITAHGGSIPVYEWFEPALDTYYNTHSGGVYTVDFNFPRKTNGNPFTTTNTTAYFAGLNGNSLNDFIFNLRGTIAEEVARNMVAVNASIFSGVDALHLFFNVPGNQKSWFHSEYGGTVTNHVELHKPNGDVIYQGPLTIQWNVDGVIHERNHIIGLISNQSLNFNGLPDRGDIINGHGNMTANFDIMYHMGNTIPNEYSLFGLPPMCSQDLIFLGWIKSDEIITINNQNLSGIKLADINYPLTTEQKSGPNRSYRIAKVILHSDWDGQGHDEYLLLEYHNATEFDKNFTNYDEPSNNRYNKGILVWHIKEKVNMLNTPNADNLIDVELAVPYNGYYGDPYPNDSYPRNYTRDDDWNGIITGDFDYLDDLQDDGNHHFIFLPDGGRHKWETTVPGPYPWYPPATQWFYRSVSLKSDFFTSATIKGRINNKITSVTYPSTRDWDGKLSYMSITNITQNSGYMTFDVQYNVTTKESINQTATAQNNQRKIVKDGSGNYHIVYSSGGNIYYQRVTGGTTLTPPIILNTVSQNNDYPSIAISSGTKLYVVWQRKTATNTYDIYYKESGDDGLTWQTFTASYGYYRLSQSAMCNTDPMPTIIADISNSNRITVVFSTSSCLKSYTTTSESPLISSWSIENITQSTASLGYPSLADVGNSNVLTMAYQNNSDNHVYYRYQANGDWTDTPTSCLSAIVPGAGAHKNPTITGIPNSPNLHAAWYNIKNSGSSQYDHVIIHRKTASYSTWPGEYSATYYESQMNPSITGLSSTKVDLLFQHRTSNIVYKQRYNGTTWNAPTSITSNGKYPSISSGASTAKYVWTDVTVWPYTVQMSTETLSKDEPTEDIEKYYSRSVAFIDTANTNNFVEYILHDIKLVSKDGSEKPVSLIPASCDEKNLSSVNAFSVQGTDYFSTNDADNIVIEYTLNSSNIDKVITDGQKSVSLKINLVDEKGNEIETGSTNVDITKAKDTFDKSSITIPLSGNYSNVRINTCLEGLSTKEGMIVSLGHLYDFTTLESDASTPQKDGTDESIPNSFSLGNYPNPFNPTTTIAFSVPERANVVLKVFDLLGQQIAVFNEGMKQPGSYEIEFNAEQLPSGVYVYTLQANDRFLSKKMILLR